jgi:hypothetical protein
MLVDVMQIPLVNKLHGRGSSDDSGLLGTDDLHVLRLQFNLQDYLIARSD